MKYYVTTDVHGFFSAFKTALTEKGFFEDKEEHKLIICGDVFDRGNEALELQEFILDLMAQDKVILIRGNHEDLMLELIQKWEFESYFDYHHEKNGTLDTVLQLTGSNFEDLVNDNKAVYEKLKNTPFIKQIIPSMLNYFETEHYIFVHGWIPCFQIMRSRKEIVHEYDEDWRKTDEFYWNKSRWINGIKAAYQGVLEKNKTIVCGHWHTSYGHSRYKNDGGEFDNNPNFNPYYADGIIALDACTAFSNQVNCIVIED